MATHDYRDLLEGVVAGPDEELDETTVAGTGVGKYSAPLGMARRGRFSSVGALSSQFDQCARTMGRADMLKQCRRLGLSMGHLNDEDLRKTLTSMSFRNKRKFVGD
jgi:hypothetical protein